MAKTLERNHDEPVPREEANQELLRSKIAASNSSEHDDQNRLEFSDLKAILSPTLQPAILGRKPLFGR